MFLFFWYKSIDKKIYEQSLDTNLIIANNYNFTKNIFIEYEFWQIHN